MLTEPHDGNVTALRGTTVFLEAKANKTLKERFNNMMILPPRACGRWQCDGGSLRAMPDIPLACG
jgi:hypothetical protein